MAVEKNKMKDARMELYSWERKKGKKAAKNFGALNGYSHVIIKTDVKPVSRSLRKKKKQKEGDAARKKIRFLTTSVGGKERGEGVFH